MKQVLAAVLAFVAFAQARAADDALQAVDRRLDARPDEIPRFQRHVLPVLSRLGCNGRACHGSFQGQGRFRLSLFGYDFASDHDALAGGEEPRIQGRLLKKATRTIAHKGGKVIEPGRWQYRLIERWIRAGAPKADDDDVLLSLYEADPLECPRCKGPMRVIALIDDPGVVRRILEHLGRWAPEASERGPPLPDPEWPANAVIPLTYHPLPDIA